MDYLPYFIYTFEELGRIGIGKGRGKYELQEVVCDGKQIYNSKERQLKQFPENLRFNLFERFEPAALNHKSLTLNFLTPARIIVNADLVVDLEFHHLIRSLLRRISTISYFHYSKRLELDFKGMIERAQTVNLSPLSRQKRGLYLV